MGKYTREDLETLVILLENHDEGDYFHICKRVVAAYNDGRTNVRFSFSDKDVLAYKLESDMLSDDEIRVLEKVTGSKYSNWQDSKALINKEYGI